MTASRTLAVTALAAATAAPGTARAACPPQAEIDHHADAVADGKTVAPYTAELNTEDAYCIQARYVSHLTDAFGDKVGYKVAFTSDAAQTRFGVPGPARGVLLADMLHANDATLPVDFASHPLIEPDLLVTITDDAIMQAETPLEAAQHLGEVQAFLELPALPLHEETGINGRQLIAFNTGARAGIRGTAIPFQATTDFVDALADMHGVLRDESGKVLARAGGDAILGQPLNALLWLIEHLRAHGESLQAGQVVSLGSLAAPRPLEAGRTYTLTYRGLPGEPLRATVAVEENTGLPLPDDK